MRGWYEKIAKNFGMELENGNKLFDQLRVLEFGKENAAVVSLTEDNRSRDGPQKLVSRRRDPYRTPNILFRKDLWAQGLTVPEPGLAFLEERRRSFHSCFGSPRRGAGRRAGRE